MKFKTALVAGCLLTSISSANPAHDKVAGLAESERRTMLAAFLVASGERCAKATKTFFQGSTAEGNAFWNVACEGGGSWLIQINNDSTGSTRILSCTVLKSVGGGTCFTKFKDRR
jgi:hypothetical protein